MATVERPPETASLEDEVRHLELEENELENRASTLEMRSIFALFLAGFATIVAIAALAVALIESGKDNGGSTSGVVANTPVSPGSASQSAMGPGMMNSGSTQAVAPVVGGAHVINVQLGEMFARPSVTSVPAGKVTFKATNTGSLVHELMVERMPIKFDSPGNPTEDAALGMIEDMDPGKSGQMTLKLTPGKYMLFCNVSGHYAAGQHTVLTVTRS